jgi:hypothetical protein
MAICEGCEDDHTCIARCELCAERHELNRQGLCASCAMREAA